MLILFEGLDFSGKETLAYKFIEALNVKGITAKYGTRTLVGGVPKKLVDYTYKSENLPSAIKTITYGIVPFIDTLFFQPPKYCLVHESYIYRSIAYHYAKGNYLFSNWMSKCIPFFVKFDLVVYLVADFDERVRRYELTQNRNERDDRRFSEPEKFQRIHFYLEDIMQKIPNCFRFDTTGETPEQSHQKIWHTITPMLIKKYSLTDMQYKGTENECK